MEEQNSLNECPICLQPLLYPVKLPCSHLFCWLCLKGIRANPAALKTCAMCRKPFSLDQIEQIVEIEKDGLEDKIYKWFYERKSGGYWAFDKINSCELEKAFSEKKNQILLSIAGYSYCIDFEKWIQYPTSHPERIRKVKRCEELNNVEIKGVAGLRMQNLSSSSSPGENKCDDVAGGSTDISNNLSESLQINDDDDDDEIVTIQN